MYTFMRVASSMPKRGPGTKEPTPIDRELEEEELDHHPLLGEDSVMHYVSEPTGPFEFHGFDARVALWSKGLATSVARSREQDKPLFKVDHYALLSATAKFERLWLKQREFMDLVVSSTPKHVIGYWMGSAPAPDTLFTLCRFTRPQGICLVDRIETRLDFCFFVR